MAARHTPHRKTVSNPLPDDAPAFPTAKEQQDAVALPPVVDPPPILDLTQLNVLPLESAPPVGVPNKRIRILRNERSASAAGAHYSLNAGDIMVLPQPVADELIAQRLAEEI